MSTWWYYECLNHDPPIRSDDEFTQHTNDSAFQRGVALLAERHIMFVPDEDGDYFERRARRFLAAHPTCMVGLVNEYGEHRPASDR